jgi:hypothetical protein
MYVQYQTVAIPTYKKVCKRGNEERGKRYSWLQNLALTYSSTIYISVCFSWGHYCRYCLWRYSCVLHNILHNLTYLRSWALLEKPPIVQPLKSFPAFYGTRRFNTLFTRAIHWSLSWVISIQYPPTYVLVFPVVSFLLACPPISYMHSSSQPFVLHAPPISSGIVIRGIKYGLYCHLYQWLRQGSDWQLDLLPVVFTIIITLLLICTSIKH